MTASHVGNYGLNPADVGTVQVVSASTLGLPTVKLSQKIGGLDVFNSEVRAQASKRRKQFVPRRTLPLRAEALRQLGSEQAAAAIYATLDMPDQHWNAVGRAHDWQTLATQGPKDWKPAAALLLATAATAQPPLGLWPATKR